MPFAYAGTRRRRNRDRRRASDTPDANSPEHKAQTPSESPLARNESTGNAERRESTGIDHDRSKPDERRGDIERGEGGSGLTSQDLHDPGSRDPNAPPVDNRS
ncbi:MULTISPECIES: hypothetical protein [unclassified Cupriavidus]|uniref:hypothetical protein n=1 Tax=unclassified Cupriavidus TaxID=2640874 RepID=UPI0010F69823|nr:MULTISPECIES: hypothetical protein [unclassified Cupriavidus]MWL89788.1 hypothetical protein [Cupriavidus sp. SW-Y-13]